MSVFEVRSRLTMRTLDKRSRHDLARMVLDYADANERLLQRERELEAQMERLRGLVNWAAGRLLDAGDVAGHEEVLRRALEGENK